MATMLILRGIAGTFGGKKYPRGALDEPSAMSYAAQRDYTGKVLDVSGETGQQSAQVNLALKTFRADPTIEALYGFSGGGYNIFWILTRLTVTEKKRLKLLVVIGAPKMSAKSYEGNWELVYRTDPPTKAGGHMGGPLALLKEGPTIA
jgi:hypothetical protein